MLHSITRQLGTSWIRERLSGKPKLRRPISNINHSDYFSTKTFGWRRGFWGGICLSLVEEKWCLLWRKKKKPFSLGEPVWTSGPWKLSNNNSPPAKNPHLFSCTTLSGWFLSICSPTQPHIQANHHDCYHQRWTFGGMICWTQMNHTLHVLAFVSYFNNAAGVDGVRRLKESGRRHSSSSSTFSEV